MAWQVLAMWLIVIVTVTWFVRDERRLRREAALARAARFYAHAPKYRHVTVDEEPIAPPRPAPRGLSQTQREFLEAWSKAANRPESA